MRRLRYLVFVGALGGLVLAATPALAQVSGSDTPITTPTTVQVLPETEEPGTPVEVAGAVEDPGDPGVLPFTGADIAVLVVLAGAAIGVGTLFVVRGRARSRVHTA